MLTALPKAIPMTSSHDRQTQHHCGLVMQIGKTLSRFARGEPAIPTIWQNISVIQYPVGCPTDSRRLGNKATDEDYI